MWVGQSSRQLDSVGHVFPSRSSLETARAAIMSPTAPPTRRSSFSSYQLHEYPVDSREFLIHCFWKFFVLLSAPFRPYFTMANRRNPLPALSELPLHEGDPPNSAWGLWGDSKEASLGSLNYLTDEVVLRTVKEEVKTGARVGLE